MAGDDFSKMTEDLSRELLQRPVRDEERAVQGLPKRGIPRIRARQLALPLVVLGLVAYALVLVRTAWLCDDAYVTFRSAYHLVHGFGPNWNVAERVQAFVHPLWMLLLAGLYALTGEMYFTPLVTSIVLALAAAVLLAFQVARTRGGAMVGLCVWIGSRALMDYSTSGLEGPLAHLLLVLLFLSLVHGWRPWIVGGLTAAVLLSRTDYLLLVLPALVPWLRAKDGGAGKRRAFALALVPLFLWHGFALLYYGYVLPNPARAWLASGVGLVDLSRQGLVYLEESLRFDPLTLPVVAVGCIGSIWLSWRQRAMALGILSYLAFVVLAGGDRTSGRFLAAELVWGTLLFIRVLERLPRVVEWVLAVPLVVVGLFAPHPSLASGADYGLERGNDFADAAKAAQEIVGEDGIADERAWSYRLTGLLRVEFDGLRPIAPLAADPRYQEIQRLVASGRRVIVTDAAGLHGFFLGPDVHVVDTSGAADPLLCKLAPVDAADRRGLRSRRPVPCGYEESLETDENRLRDENLKRVYDAVRACTRGPLLGGRRLWEIVKLHAGRYGDAVEAYRNDEGCP